MIHPPDITSRARLAYRADIDGMRAIAVVAVLLFHSGLAGAGGFVGVDVFFVISGFLITSLVMREIEEGTFSYVRFWERRTLRLMPAMFVVVVATVMLGYLILLPHDFRELGQSVCAQSIAAANFFFYRESGYFAGASEIKPLLHTWSLAVEEQFYLLMPAVLLIFHRLGPSRVFPLLAVVFLASLTWCICSTAHFPDGAFYLLPARAWEMLLGGIVALAGDFRWLNRPLAELISIAGLGAVFSSMVFFQDGTPFPGSWAILPCAGTAAMIAGNSMHSTITAKLLSLRPVAFVGLISYSLYLWHWPLFAFANYLSPGELPEWLALSLLAASFSAGWLSWRYVETPFRSKSNFAARFGVLRATSVTLLTLVVIGSWLHLADGVRSRFSEDVLVFADARQDRNPQRRLHHDLSAAALKNPPALLVKTSELEPELIVVGDSHGDAMLPGIVELCSKHGVAVVAFTRSATLPLSRTANFQNMSQKNFRDSAFRYIEHSSAKNVMLIARWSEYGDRLEEQDVVATAALLKELGKNVWLIRQIPEPAADVPRFLALAKIWGGDDTKIRCLKPDYVASQSSVNRIFDSVRAFDVAIVDVSSKFYESSEFAAIEADGHPLYFDDNHLSVYGARFTASSLEAIIVSIASFGR